MHFTFDTFKCELFNLTYTFYLTFRLNKGKPVNYDYIHMNSYCQYQMSHSAFVNFQQGI